MTVCLVLILDGLQVRKIKLKKMKKAKVVSLSLKNISVSTLFLLSLFLITVSPVEALTGKNINSNEIKVNSKEDIDSVFELGSKAYENQKYEEAINILKKITEKFPGYGDAHYYIGLSYFALGKYYLAIAAFLEANKIYGDNRFDALFGAGLSYLSSGYTDEARMAFQRVIKESKDIELAEDAKNWLNSIDEQILQKEKTDLIERDMNFRAGIKYLNDQDYQNAETSFTACLSNKPDSVLSLYYLGNTLYLSEKYKEAIDIFEKIILIEPDSKIASDARLYIRVIDELTASLPVTRPYYLQLSVGGLYDSNLSYADIRDTIISDISGVANLSAGYLFNNNFQVKYNFYGNLFSGINDKIEGLTVHSYNFNLQRHNANAKLNYPFFSNFLGEIDYNFNWYVLGGNSFLLNNRVAPRINFYISPNLITVLQYSIDFNSYPTFKTRNSLDHSLDLSQYFYLLNNNLWFRIGYNLQKINANDQIQKQTGSYADGSKYILEYNFVNSLLSNNLLFDLGFNWILNSKLKFNAKISFNGYDTPDIYRLTSPSTNISTGQTETKIIKQTQKTRSDILYSIGVNYSLPVYTNLWASLSYTFLNNTSNISRDDYIGRSYSKHFLGINLSYEF